MALGDNIGSSIGGFGGGNIGSKVGFQLGGPVGGVVGGLAGRALGSFGFGGFGGFGGKGHHRGALPEFTIPENTPSILDTPNQFRSFRGLGGEGGILTGQRKSINNVFFPALNELRDLQVSAGTRINEINSIRNDLKRQFQSFASATPSSPADMVRRNQGMANVASGLIAGINNFRSDLGLGPRIAPGSQPEQQEGIGDRAGRAAVQVAGRFLRRPQLPERTSFGTGGFTQKSSRGFGDVSELKQEADVIVPSGFTQKQATSPERASRLRNVF